MAVLFSLVLAACTVAPAPQAPVFSSRIAWRESLSMKKGESLMTRLFALEDGKERRVLAGKTGPVHSDCSQGCGTLRAQTNANPGLYRLEFENDTRPGIASVTFQVGDNEIWSWNIMDADVSPSFRPYANDSVKTVQAGPYRIDLFDIGVVDMNAGALPARQQGRKRIPAHFPKDHPEARR